MCILIRIFLLLFCICNSALAETDITFYSDYFTLSVEYVWLYLIIATVFITSLFLFPKFQTIAIGTIFGIIIILLMFKAIELSLVLLNNRS